VLWHCIDQYFGSSAFSVSTLFVGWQERHPACKKVVECWRGYLSGARCRFAYGSVDPTANHCLLLRSVKIGFIFLVRAHPVCPGQRAVKRVLLAHRSMSGVLMWSNIRPSHLSVSRCEQWQHGWLDLNAVWSGEWGRDRYGCIRFWWWSLKGKGSLGTNTMQKWRIDWLSTRVWNVDNISLRRMYRWILWRIGFLMI